MSLRSEALAVTLPGFAGGAFPFLRTLDGCPTASANVAQEQEDLLEKLGKLLSGEAMYE